MTTTLPNILFITADQWRGDCLSAMQHRCVQTPNIDRLAADGVLFERHYAQCTPCGPSRASLLTGMYLHNHRAVINGAPLDARHTNVALEARKAGYHPVLFGYTDISADPRGRHPNDPDLKTYEGILPGLTPALDMTQQMLRWQADLIEKGYDENTVRTNVYRPKPTSGGAGPTFAPALYSDEDSDTAFVTRAAMGYMQVASQPWFAHISYLRPHPPYHAPEPWHELYNAPNMPAPMRRRTLAADARQHPFLARSLEMRAMQEDFHCNPDGPHPQDMSVAQIRQLRATYFALISHVDAWIGRLIEFLKATGQYNSTLIVLTSDHGDVLGDHWQVGKTSYFDSAFHIPLIVRDPATRRRGLRVSQFTEHVDVMPTLLERIGVAVPRQCDGNSLMSFVRNKQPAQWRDAVFYEHDFRDIVDQRWLKTHGLRRDECVFNAVRSERYKYVHFAGLPPLLFDLQEDPYEFRNLAASRKHASIVQEHTRRLLEWRMRNDERVLTGLELTEQGVIDHE